MSLAGRAASSPDVRGTLGASLMTLSVELVAVDGIAEYAVFGSTALALRGIIGREPADVDVMVTRRVWGALLARYGWDVLTPAAGDPPILARATIRPLHLFYEWRDDAVEIDPAHLIATAESVRGVKLAAVEEVLRHKRSAYAWLDRAPGVAKHLPDIHACERWLARRPVVSE